MDNCFLLLGVLFITLVIIWFFVLSSSLSGVICLLKLNEMLWSSLSNLISPLSSLLTLIVLSFFLILKLHGLHFHLIPLGFISMSFLNLFQSLLLLPSLPVLPFFHLLVEQCHTSQWLYHTCLVPFPFSWCCWWICH